jgi:hypothetical protein
VTPIVNAVDDALWVNDERPSPAGAPLSVHAYVIGGTPPLTLVVQIHVAPPRTLVVPWIETLLIPVVVVEVVTVMVLAALATPSDAGDSDTVTELAGVVRNGIWNSDAIVGRRAL